jgi:hypothetical protein
MTFAPGKWAGSLYSNIYWKRDLEKDLKRLKQEYNISYVLTLME